ncbi:MAG TPA: hypothetical protein P5181_12680 [Dermatophilaceae bacterium]|nr:hypothetical protein [Dermatophilaceae bacterium]
MTNARLASLRRVGRSDYAPRHEARPGEIVHAVPSDSVGDDISAQVAAARSAESAGPDTDLSSAAAAPEHLDATPPTRPTPAVGEAAYETRTARRLREEAAREQRPVARLLRNPWLLVGAMIVGVVVLQIGVWGLMTARMPLPAGLLLLLIGAAGTELAWRRRRDLTRPPAEQPSGEPVLATAPPTLLSRLPVLSVLLVVAVLIGWAGSRLISAL